MAPESENNLRLQIGHVLFIELVGYSELLIEEQKERLPHFYTWLLPLFNDPRFAALEYKVAHSALSSPID